MQLKSSGGIERFVSTLASALSVENEVEIVANYGRPSDAPFFKLPKNVSVKYLYPTQPKEISLRKLLREHKIGAILKEPRRRFLIKYSQRAVFRKFLRNLNTDVIITERATYNKLVQKYYRGSAKKIASDHNFHQNNHKYIHELTTSIRGFDYLVVCSSELYDFYKDMVLPVKCKLISIPIAAIPEKKTDFSSKNIISVGRMVPEKDFPALIRVMKLVHAENPDAKLFLVGCGKDFTSIRHLVAAEKMQDYVVLTGELTQSEIAKLYYKSSIFAMTSITEAFGLVLAEAMSYGLPVVAFDRASGAREQINEKNGILVPNANEKMMAHEIISLLNNEKMLKKYQSGALTYIETLKPEEIIKNWGKLL